MKSSWAAIKNMFSGSYTANICGHKTKIEGMTESFGSKYLMKMPKSENGCPDYCLTCIGKMAILCTWCGKPIYIGEPITLLATQDETFAPPPYAVKYGESKPQSYVGCLRWECGESGLFRAGFWYPPGKVNRVPTPLEMALAGNGSNMVIVHDLSDPHNIGSVIPKNDS